jgi:uncharacterized protein (TIGR02996 family)
MSDRAAFLDAIRAEPAEDTPRLAFADWLDENGSGERDARHAAVIRYQCGLARIAHDHNHARSQRRPGTDAPGRRLFDARTRFR